MKTADVLGALLRDASNAAGIEASARQAALGQPLLGTIDPGARIRELIAGIGDAGAMAQKAMEGTSDPTAIGNLRSSFSLPMTPFYATSQLEYQPIEPIEFEPSPLIGDTARVADGVEALVEAQTAQQQQLAGLTAAIGLLAERQEATLGEMRNLRKDQRSPSRWTRVGAVAGVIAAVGAVVVVILTAALLIR